MTRPADPDRLPSDAESLTRELAFRSALENALPVGIAAVDRDGRQIYVNETLARMLGWRVNELVGRTPPFPYWPPEEISRIGEALDATLNGEYPSDGWLLRFRRADDSRFLVRVRLAPLAAADAGPAGWVASVTDETDSEQRYRLATLASNDVIWDWTPATDDAFWSDALETLFGHDARAASAHPGGANAWWVSHLHPDDRERVVAEYEGAILGGANEWRSEYRFQRADGSYANVNDRCRIARDTRGRVERVVGVMRDVTAERRAAARQHFLAEAGSVLASSLDYRSTLSAVARLAVPELADYARVDLVGEDGRVHLVEVTHPDPQKRDILRETAERWPVNRDDASGIGAVLRTGRSNLAPVVDDEALVAFTTDARRLRFLRLLGPRSTMIVPIVGRERVLGAITLNFAESGRRYDEGDLALAEELARRAAVAIENAALYGAALDASRAKSDFLAVMSHELRTPLNAVLGHASLMSEGILGPVSERQRESLERIRNCADHLAALVDEVLSLARLEAGREPLDVKPVDLAAIVREIREMLEPSASSSGIRLAVDLPGAPLELRTDATKLRQILLNLLGNAMKFTGTDGEVRIVVSPLPDGGATVAVHDTGIGISRDNVDRIFEPFWQVERGPTRRAGGAGLGLSVSRQLARLLGGDIGVESTPGEGSTFTLRLPRAITPETRD